MNTILKSQLMSVTRQNTLKKGKGKDGKAEKNQNLQKYFAEDTGSEDDDEFDNDGDGDDTFQNLDKVIMNQDKEQLIDLELVNLLKYCSQLYNKQKLDNETYQEEIMLKSIELGKKTRQKLLILDMDETMVSARFKTKLPEGFQTTFSIDF